MGYNSAGWYGMPPGPPGPAGANAGAGGAGSPRPVIGGTAITDVAKVREASEKDVMAVLAMVRKEFNVDDRRIYLMGHSMGGAGTYHLGGKYNDIWAGIAPIAGAGGIADAAAAERYRSFATLLMHGEKDSIVSANGSRRAAMLLQGAGAQHLYLEFPGKDHEFWIRRGAEHMEKVFLFFSTVSKRTNRGFLTPDKIK
jgi:predicted esterase